MMEWWLAQSVGLVTREVYGLVDQSLICHHRNSACDREKRKIILIKQVQGDFNEFVILTLFHEPTVLNPPYEMTTDRNHYFTGTIRKGHFESGQAYNRVMPSVPAFSLPLTEKA